MTMMSGNQGIPSQTMVVMTNNAIAIIPARGGSKGLPRKNILNLAGKPLISWTIEACLQSSFVSRVVVSSDDQKILEVASNSGAELLLRPSQLATDRALTVPVISHVISSLEGKLEGIKYIVLMQPTSPLRTVDHLNAAFSTLLESDATSLISVTKPTQNPLKAFRYENGYLRGLVNDHYPFMRRQDLPNTYLANGAIYIIVLNEFKDNPTLLTDKCIPFEMDAKSSLDIDNLNDLEIAESFITKELP
jgi:CMP-N,N'-diacetyllegionaminic acid synthase